MQFILYYKSKTRKYIGIAALLHFFFLSAEQANLIPKTCPEKICFELNKNISSNTVALLIVAKISLFVGFCKVNCDSI